MARQNQLERTIFETSRASEYFNVRELQALTGQPAHNFVTVALKDARQWIKKGFEKDDSQWWRNIIKDKIEATLSEHESDMEKIIKAEISKTIE